MERPLPPAPPGWPLQQEQVQGLQAGRKLSTDPYPPARTAEPGETLASDYASMSSSGVVGKIAAEAARVHFAFGELHLREMLQKCGVDIDFSGGGLCGIVAVTLAVSRYPSILQKPFHFVLNSC